MPPAQEFAAQFPGNGVFLSQEPEHRAPKRLGKQRLRYRGKRHEPTIRQERSVGGEHMYVRVEVRQIPEGLHEQDQPGT